VVEICRSLQITEQTFYRWKKSTGASGLPRSGSCASYGREQEAEALVADLTLDKHILQESLKKKVLRPRERRLWVEWARAAYQVSVRRACVASGFSR